MPLTVSLVLLAFAAFLRVAAAGPADLSATAEQLADTMGVPGLVLAATSDEGLIAWGAAGIRAVDGDDPILRTDRFHLGSLTKAMTATLAARLVEQDLIAWNSTVSDVCPETAAKVPEHARAITLAELLTHRSGMPDDRNDIDLIRNLWMLSGDLAEQRARAAAFMIGRVAEGERPAGFAYANANYVVAAHMLECASGRSWEDLIRVELFEPLGLATAGHGPPGSDSDDPQPRGHMRTPEGLRPLPPLDGTDNPPVTGPAGRVHMSIEDLAAFLRAHLAGLRGRGGILDAGTFTHLHTPPEGSGYAFGWGVSGEPDARVSSHAGSNTRWFAMMFVVPGENLAVAVAMNAVPESDEPVDVLEAVRSALIGAGMIGGEAVPDGAGARP